MNKRDERFAWVVDVGLKAKRSVWDRIVSKDDDDDDDLPGPNAGATIWPLPARKDIAAFG
jgi:hypothetical protein